VFSPCAFALQVAKGTTVQYWHGNPDETGSWRDDLPPTSQIRVPGMVHESSTMPIGDGALVDYNYKLKDTSNVFVTGGSLWPRGGSWNPTLTMVAMAADLAAKLAATAPKTANSK
jgi:choline dehydrogenase-like flavoprotein